MYADFKYLTHNSEDESYGLYLTVVGSEKIEPGDPYSPNGHPVEYDFNWHKGRILQEYQLIYITEGEGEMETLKASHHIKAGFMILIHPKEWHRYRPFKHTGWLEHYIGFRGDVAERFINSSKILENANTLNIGFHEGILHDFKEILIEARNETPGYHQVCAGLILHILGKIISIKKNEVFSNTQIENTIKKACIIIQSNLQKNMNVKSLASELNVDYSLFRKVFKKYTGLSPMQYHISLRMKQAIFLLTETNLSIKEIAFRMGFCSVYYFSRLFKEKVRITPSDYRNGIREESPNDLTKDSLSLDRLNSK